MHSNKYFLNLNLQFFAADGGAAGGSEGGDATGDGDKGGSSVETAAGETGDQGTAAAAVDTSWIDSLYTDADDKTEEIDDSETMIPKKRFDSINSKYKDASTIAKAMATEFDALKVEHTELTTAHKEAADRVKSLESVLSGMVDTHMESIDESYHDLIPADKTVEEKLSWIIKAKEKGMFGGGSGSYEIEIGGMTNPSQGRGSRSTSGMNPLQLMQMGYGGN